MSCMESKRLIEPMLLHLPRACLGGQKLSDLRMLAESLENWYTMSSGLLNASDSRSSRIRSRTAWGDS